MDEFTTSDIQNILGLIALADIKGKEATPVAILQQKLSKLLEAKLKKDESVQNTPKGK